MSREQPDEETFMSNLYKEEEEEINVNYIWTKKHIETFLGMELPTYDQIYPDEMDNIINDYGNDYVSNFITDLLESYHKTYLLYDKERTDLLREHHEITYPLPPIVLARFQRGLSYFRNLCEMLRCY